MINNPANSPTFLVDLEQRMLSSDEKRAAVHELFRRAELQWLLHDGQREIAKRIENTDSKEFLVLCSRQFGKSFFSLVYALSFLQKNPNSKAIIFSATGKQATTIVNDNMNLLLRFAPQDFLTRQKTERRWVLGNGSELRIGSIEEADASRGVNGQLIILEEGAASCSSEQYNYALSSVIGPMLLRAQNGRLIHVTTPSTDLNHCLHTEILPRLEAKGAVARFTIFDNPQLTEQQILDAKDRCKTPEAWDREYLVKIVKSETLTVVPEFEEETSLTHEDYKLPDLAHWCVGLDLGGVQDKTVAVLGFYHFQKARMVIWDERVFPVNTSSETIAREVNQMLEQVPASHKERSVTADAPGQVRIDLNRLGLSTFSPRKGQGSFEAGINNLRYLIRKQELLVHPRCNFLIRSLKFGQFNRTRTDFQRSEELGHCDAIAALIYYSRHQRTDNPYPATFKLHKDSHFYDLKDETTDALEEILLG